MNAFYLRVSTEEQKQAQTIRTQEEFADRYTALHGFAASRYPDDGVSGSIPLADRPGGGRLLADVRAGLIRTVYLWKLDRIGREPRLILNAVHALEELGCRIVSCTEPFDTSTPAGRLMLSMLASFAGFERDSIAERTNAGVRRAAREGRFTGGIVPYGYRVETAPDGRRTLQPDEEPLPGLEMSRAGVMRLAFRLYAEEGWSAYRVAEHLNELGIPTGTPAGSRVHPRSGRPVSGGWHGARLSAMLLNPVYRGEWQFGRLTKKDREPERATVPALISPTLWEAALSRREHNRCYRNRPDHRNYLLRGLLICGECGMRYAGQAAARGSYLYYRCGGKGPQPGKELCTSNNLPASIEAEVWAEVVKDLDDPGRLLDRLEEGNATGDSRQRLEAEAERLVRSLAQRGEERERVVALYRRGRIDEGTLDRQLDEVSREEERFRGELLAVRQALEETVDSVSWRTEAEAELAAVRLILASEEPEWECRRRVLEAALHEIRVVSQDEPDAKGRRVALRPVWKVGAVFSVRR